MSRLTQAEFKERCTAEMWEEYVKGLICEAAERDSYQLNDGILSFIPEVGGAQSSPVLVWNGTDKEWEEDGSWYGDD